MRRTNREPQAEDSHQKRTLDQELHNRDQIVDLINSLPEKFIRKLASWDSFHEYFYCQLDGDVLGFTSYLQSTFAQEFIERNCPNFVVTRRESHTNYYLKVQL